VVAAAAHATVARRASETVDRRVRLRIRLVSTSVLKRFVELALISWTAANNIRLATSRWTLPTLTDLSRTTVQPGSEHVRRGRER